MIGTGSIAKVGRIRTIPTTIAAATMVAALLLAGCRQPAPAVQAGSGDAAFQTLAREIIDDAYRRSPSFATYQGVHQYDDRLETLSAEAIAGDVMRAQTFRARLDAIDPATLSLEARLDREMLQHEMDALVLTLDVVRPWAKNPDLYSGTATDAVFSIMKRAYAPAEDRLRRVIARERQIPRLLAEARANLDNPPQIFTQIAIEQSDGVQSFFRTDLPLAFADVSDPGLRAEFKTVNDATIAALADYQRWLKSDLLPRSGGTFALGAPTYAQLLSATNMIDTPLDELLRVAETDRTTNEQALTTAAHAIDATAPVDAVLRRVTANHPRPDQLLATTQRALDSLRDFITAKDLVTIPPSAPAQVRETPPFMRATTTASMDTPGPWETTASEAYYYMTLPDRRWPAAEQESFMRQWYLPAILNVSVHEVYPGHYLQFLNARSYPTDVRKVFGASSNSEGWAHYVEQLMVDEGFQADDPAYRLAQAQDALLRDVRFIVGIKLHTQGMTIDEAARLFETQGHQPPPVARSEARRGAGDPLYGYYTMGKLAILKLRRDYRAQKGADFTLKGFHDAFIHLGPLPLPLVREAMLGERSTLF